MLTGRVPFNGETTVAIAIKHIQEEMPSPKEFVPEIPASVEGIVLKCCQKSPDRRYQNMQELIADLKQSLMNPEEFVVQNEPDMVGGTRPITDRERAQIKRRAAYQEYQHREYEEREEPMRLRSEAEPVYEEEEEPEEEDDDYDYNPKMERVTTVLALLAGVVICVIVVILAVKVFGGREGSDGPGNSPIIADESESSTETSSVEEEPVYVKMPPVKGKSVEEARNELKNLGLDSEVEYEESDDVELGKVISADVEEGADVQVGSKVKLLASAGSQGIEVPLVEGDTFEEAQGKLVAQGFAVTREERTSNDVAEGYVISQVPSAQTKVPKGTNITVTVSQGKEKVRVPNVVGLLEEDGTVEVIEAGLQIGTVEREFNDLEEGKIFYQSYSKGSYVEPGTMLDIKVSLGPKAVTYKCNASILGPTVEEAPDYVAGTEVLIVLTTDDEKILLETRTASFPVSANYDGLTASGGTITMTYTVTIGGGTSTDPETGETIQIPGTSEERSFTRRIEFVEE